MALVLRYARDKNNFQVVNLEIVFTELDTFFFLFYFISACTRLIHTQKRIFLLAKEYVLITCGGRKNGKMEKCE